MMNINNKTLFWHGSLQAMRFLRLLDILKSATRFILNRLNNRRR